MLTKKTEVLQIRIETELLNRFKKMADERGAKVSVLLRYYMNEICTQYEVTKLRKVQYQKQQAEKRR
jgi:antitoxin component of RelBE/YafQ-DinJ toxin-antitoxin module